MFNQRGWFWVRFGLAFFVSLGVGCRRPPTTAISASTTTTAVAATLPTTRAAGEFVRTPRRIVWGADEVRFPLQFVTYTPVVAFTSADGVQRRMTLDTGADSVVMTPGFAAAAQLATRPSNRTFRDASGTGSDIAIATVGHLDLGAVAFEDFDADVLGLRVGSDALLGWPMWRDVLVTIDYPRSMLVLKKGGLPVPDGKRILPLRLENDRLMVQATLDGRETWLNLDTGWGSGDSVELTAASAAAVAWVRPPVSTIAGNTPGGATHAKLGRLKGDLLLGTYRFVQPVAGTNTGVATDILAAPALAKFTLTLDLHNMRAQFDRASEVPIAPEPVFVAGFDCDLRNNPLKVTGVLAGSDAERAGLHAGDLLVTIDGKAALDGLLSHNGGAFSIEMQRGDRKSALTVPMTKLVP